MAYKMKGNPMQRNFGIGGPMRKNDELPKGFYDSYKTAAQENADGKTINMGATKTASTKSGKFTPIYT